MRDIRYKWNEGPNSVGVSSEVSLPQFKVLGHRQRAMEISLTTGTCRRSPISLSKSLSLSLSVLILNSFYNPTNPTEPLFRSFVISYTVMSNNQNKPQSNQNNK